VLALQAVLGSPWRMRPNLVCSPSRVMLDFQPATNDRRQHRRRARPARRLACASGLEPEGAEIELPLVISWDLPLHGPRHGQGALSGRLHPDHFGACGDNAVAIGHRGL